MVEAFLLDSRNLSAQILISRNLSALELWKAKVLLKSIWALAQHIGVDSEANFVICKAPAVEHQAVEDQEDGGHPLPECPEGPGRLFA